MNKIIFKIYITPETKRKIKAISLKEKKSQSQVARHWIEEYIDTLYFPEDDGVKADE